MRNTLVTGLEKRVRLQVDAGRCVGHLGADSRVYSTPALINDIEFACRDLLLEHLEAGEDSVGTHVDIQHLAATPLDLEVEIVATIREIDRRAVQFEIEVHDPLEKIAHCRHSRFVVDIEQMKQRIADKAARASKQAD